MDRWEGLKLKISSEQREYARRVARDSQSFYLSGEAKNRNCGDSEVKSFVGYLCETVVADFFGCDRPSASGLDGGFDLVISGKRFDVKSSNFEKFNKLYLIAYDYDVDKDFDGYMFCWLNDGFVDIVGWCWKRWFFKKCYSKDFGFGFRKVLKVGRLWDFDGSFFDKKNVSVGRPCVKCGDYVWSAKFSVCENCV